MILLFLTYSYLLLCMDNVSVRLCSEISADPETNLPIAQAIKERVLPRIGRRIVGTCSLIASNHPKVLRGCEA